MTKGNKSRPSWLVRGGIVFIGLILSVWGVISWRVAVDGEYVRRVNMLIRHHGRVYYNWQNPKVVVSDTFLAYVNGEAKYVPYNRPETSSFKTVEDGVEVIKKVTFHPRKQIRVKFTPAPMEGMQDWLSKDKMKDITMVSIPVSSCEDHILNELQGLPSLQKLLLRPIDPDFRGEVVPMERLAAAKSALPKVEILTACPNFEKYVVDETIPADAQQDAEIR